MDPIFAPCRRDFFPASRSSGYRLKHQVIWIVMHDEEAPTARAAAEWFHHRDGRPQGSAHLCLDDETCYRCLPDTAIPWGAPGANLKGFHIEQAGYARWSSVMWQKHIRTLRRSAFKTAKACHRFGIPPLFVNAEGLRAGHPGITTHAECSKAFGGTHWDPGRGWPRRLFIRLVQRYLEQIKAQ